MKSTRCIFILFRIVFQLIESAKLEKKTSSGAKLLKLNAALVKIDSFNFTRN